jgi:poly(3-hydroxybutyrate) depolymerase
VKRPLTVVLAATALVVVPGVPAVPATPAATATGDRHTARADRVVVEVAGRRLERPVTAGGIAVTDDIADYTTSAVTGRARLAGGARVTVDVRRAAGGLAGTLGVTDRHTSLTATVAGGVTRVSDDTVRWSGPATLTRRGGTPAAVTATVTIVDGVPDPGTHAVHLRHAGQDRVAVVHVPARRATPGRLPVLYHFPGLYETAVVADTFGHLREHADRHGYLLVVPEHYGPGWQGVLGGTPAPPDLDDPGFVRALVPAVNARFGGDPRRTYASGMSNGGFFTSLLGCRLSDVFAAFAPVTGQLNDPATCAPGRAIPVLMIHGDADPLVPYGTTAPAAAFWTSNNGCRTDTVDVPVPDVDPADGTTAVYHHYRGCPRRAPVVLVQVKGGGHAWFGGDPYPVEWLGLAGRDLVANDAIWSFVSRFRLPR